jgi:transposase-like protein
MSEAAILEVEERLRGAGVSVARICREAGMDRTTWHNWKHGARPRPESWRRVQDVLRPVIGEVPDLAPVQAAA